MIYPFKLLLNEVCMGEILSKLLVVHIILVYFQIESMKSLIGFPTSMYNDTFLLEKYRYVSIP